jgi:hypothetical protein
MASLLDIFKSPNRISKAEIDSASNPRTLSEIQGSGGYSEHPKEQPKAAPKQRSESSLETGVKALLNPTKRINDEVSKAGG